MKVKYGLALLLAGGLLACRPESQEGEGEAMADLEKELPGTWEMIDLRVDINSAGGEDTTVVFDIQEVEWERVYNVRPKRYYFELDDTYREVFRSIRDSVISSSTGEWAVAGDSLHLTEPDTSYHYQVGVRQGVAEFRALLDWDGDGAADDAYFARHRRISRSTSD